MLKCKLEKLYKRLFKRQNRTTLTPLVTVGILTYNHEQYIQQCLLGVINQQGNFRLRIVVCDDYSTDHTAEKIEDFFNQHAHKDFEIISVRNPRNIGFVNNLKQVVRYAENSDYFTFCEGDDYWLDIQRIQKHIVFMQSNPECVLTFNRIIMYFQEKNNYEFYENQHVLKGIYYNTSSLIKENFIGNFSCCFYDAEYFKEVPDSLFDMFTADWMFNIWYSTLGSIGFLGEPMSVYRKHEKGLWTGNEKADNAKKLLTYIDDYNRYLNYDFDSDFSYFRNLVRLEMGDNSKKLADLIIIDDTFPHPVSGFLYQEFTSYLQKLKSVKVLTTGLNFFLLGNSTADELLKAYKRKYPETYGKLEMLISPCEQIDCKLFYFSSLNIAARYLELVEKSRKPFIFTLCTNGGFAPDNDLSDAMLKSVMGSPSFKKVIVMQKAIYDYLIEKKFCLSDKIEYNYENQISPKVELLKMALAQPFFYNEDDFQKPVIADIPLIDTRLFVDTADGFSENNVVEMLFERSEMLDLCFDLTRFKGLKIKSLRWGPLEGQYIEVSGLEAYYTDKDGVRQDLNIISFNANQFDDQFLFLTRDPCFTFNIDDEAVTVNISCKMRNVETDEIINTWCQQIDQTLQEIRGKQNVLIERHRMNHLLKWIKKIFYKAVKRQS